MSLQALYWRIVQHPEEDSSRWLTALLTAPNHVFVLYADAFAFSRLVHERFWSAVRAQPNLSVQEHRFYQRNGEYILQIVQLTPISSPDLTLQRLYPASTRAGLGFNIQPGGVAALAVEGENFTPGTIVMFGTTPLVTTYGGPSLLTALVPAELYRRPGRYEIYLKRGVQESNRLPFVVEP